MQITLDLSDDQVRALTTFAKSHDMPLPAVIGDAIDAYIAKKRSDVHDAAFGLWGEREDGLAYQERLRSEW